MTPSPVRASALGLCLAWCTGLGAAGCATQEQLAAQLETATQQQYLPELVACWEKEFEAAGFRGEYHATVDFTVEGGTGAIRDATLHRLDTPADGDEAIGYLAVERLEECLAQALAKTDLSRGGLEPSADLRVVGFRLLLADASSEARKAALERSPNILIGPRADRCLGLYTHDPPQDAAALVAELSTAERAATKVSPSEPDQRARALQRVYDLALELAQRLRVDLISDELSAANRKKTRDEIQRADDIARRAGRSIGCTPPASVLPE
ncbi:MAG: hypothetical protein JRI23_34060 [Deltaproteobacteria bacterium]|jgi:hypothetical protein|nr:hypothetical protein [Deltaproteobacteria bacterium]MBW2537318.1 hypothetical protein [Deltaproteobacteria bacterium]